jgi:hypothetical protein
MPRTNRRRTALSAAICVLAASAAVLSTGAASSAAKATPATGSGIGVGVTNLAEANVGTGACSVNSAGTHGFNTSCTGNSGNPEAWSSDFVAWDWASEGIQTSGLTTQAGGATGTTMLSYGEEHNTAHTSPGYTAQPGDAIVFDADYDYVSIVTAVNADGSVQTVAADWGTTGPANTTVAELTIAAGQTAVGDAPSVMINKTIYAYVTPAPVASESTRLTPYSATSWTPPGSTTARTDIYAADPHGFVWDYSHTPGAATPFGFPKEIEAGWTHYREVGVADMNQDGYPDLVVIDTNTNDLDVFLNSASGFANVSTRIGEGWTSNYLMLGVADWQHTGHEGIVTADVNTGIEYFYPDDLTSGVQNQIQIGSGWTSNFTAFGLGDITGDGHNAILTCNASANQLQLNLGDLAGGTPGSPYPYDVYYVVNGCANYTFFGLTNYLNDGHPDLIIRDNTTGNIIVNPGSGALGTASSDGTVILAHSPATTGLTPFGSTTWTPPGSTTQRVDIYAADLSGNLWDYTEGANGSLGTPAQLATGWTHYREVGIADMNHDGYPDLVAIDTTNTNMYVFTGSANGLSTTPIEIGEGWATNYRIFGIADWDHTGSYGILTADLSTGTDYYYPDDLVSGRGTRQQLGGGFTNAYNAVGVAPVVGDGHSDILLCRSDLNAAMLFAGDGTGGTNYGDGTVRLTRCNNDTVFGLTDYNADGQPDLIARDNTTGDIVVTTGLVGGWWHDPTTTTITSNW